MYRLPLCLTMLALPALAAAQSPPPPLDTMAPRLHLRLPAAPQHDSGTILSHFDKPPQLIEMPTPKTRGDGRGIGGEVRLQFVVDSTGTVDPATVEVLSTTSASFTGPAIDALLLSLWRAAEWRHQRVRATVATTIRIKG